jgi:hypothetical protein
VRHRLLLIITVTTIFIARPMSTRQFYWPSVQPLEKRYTFSTAASSHVQLDIHPSTGNEFYRLQCLPGDHNRYSIESFQCGLTPAGYDNTGSLLVDDPFDWSVSKSRGVFWAQFLAGACSTYPGWGPTRLFRLRGMVLSLSILNPIFDNTGLLRSFDFTVSVGPDPTALSFIAEPNPYINPLAKPPGPDRCKPTPLHIRGTGVPWQRGLEDHFQNLKATDGEWNIRGQSVPVSFSHATEPISPSARVAYLQIFNTTGTEAYEFECSAYNEPISDGRIDRYGIECGLFASGSKINLLNEGIDPYTLMSRATIYPEQLYGTCADYPQWGKSRRFRLRHFTLTMTLDNPEFTRGDFSMHALRSVTLRVNIVPDKSADNTSAMPSRYISWVVLGNKLVGARGKCDVVLLNPSLSDEKE